MSKNKNLQTNQAQNFVLRSLNSVQIGLYIILSAYVIKSLLHAMINDDSFLGMLSIQLVEVMSLSFLILTLLLSAIAIFFSSRRKSRKFGFKVWNAVSKKQATSYFLLTLPGVFFLSLLSQNGYANYLVPFFLLFISFGLALFNQQKKQAYYLISASGAILAIITLLIPTYWYSSLLIFGITFVVYGIMNI